MTIRVERLPLHTFWIGHSASLRGALMALAVTPAIYSLALPFALLDVWVQAYQALCFRLLGIRRVRRHDYLALDRHRLAYLNAAQRVNCFYCAYVNGLIAFVREVGARTEQFWCPIKHRRPAPGQHARHHRFAPFGDAAAFHRLLPRLRQALGQFGRDRSGARARRRRVEGGMA